MTPLQQLAEHGQSVWIDYLSRQFVQDGDLAGLVDDGVVGVTSNPTIFQGAIAEGDAYDEQIKEMSASESEPKEIFLALARDDIRAACDVLRPVWDEGQRQGRLGVARGRPEPRARHRGARSRRPSACTRSSSARTCSIKIPATREGLPAIEETIAAGIPVNVTLIFSLERHREVAEAYVRGLRRLVDERRRPLEDRLRRVVLRLARRHRGRQPARRDRRPRRAQGQAGDRQRQARLRDLQGGLLRRGVGGAGRQGRDAAALPVGVDLDQEPRRTAT